MEKRYIQFPLMMLKEVHKDYNTAMQEILSFGIVNFAFKQDVSNEDSARQLIYSYYRDNEDMPTEIFRMIEGTIPEDPDYNGFLGEGDFSPDGIPELLNEFVSNSKLLTYARENCQVSKINGLFNLTGPGTNERIRKYHRIKQKIDRHAKLFGPDPYPSIELELFWDLKREEDPALFSSYIAIKSLQGNSKYTRTDKPTIVGRMVGAKSPKVLEAICKESKEARAVIEKFNKRYHFEKLMEILIRRKLVKGKISNKHWSKFVISTRLEFMELAEAYGNYMLNRDIKAKEKAALKRLQQVYNTTSI